MLLKKTFTNTELNLNPLATALKSKALVKLILTTAFTSNQIKTLITKI